MDVREASASKTCETCENIEIITIVPQCGFWLFETSEKFVRCEQLDMGIEAHGNVRRWLLAS